MDRFVRISGRWSFVLGISLACTLIALPQSLGASPQPPTSLHAGAFVDTDSDGINDEFDLDDDNDGILDVEDPNPLTPDSPEPSPSEPPDDIVFIADADGDGITDEIDPDDDNDGTPDVDDPNPLTPDPPPPDPPGDLDQDSDTDGDGIPNVLDPDDDNNGVADFDEPEPSSPPDSGEGSSPSPGTGSSTGGSSQAIDTGGAPNSPPLVRTLPVTGDGPGVSSVPNGPLSIAAILFVVAAIMWTIGRRNGYARVKKTT